MTLRDAIVIAGDLIEATLNECAALRTHFESVLPRYQRRVSRADWEDFQRKVEAFYQ